MSFFFGDSSASVSPFIRCEIYDSDSLSNEHPYFCILTRLGYSINPLRKGGGASLGAYTAGASSSHSKGDKGGWTRAVRPFRKRRIR